MNGFSFRRVARSDFELIGKWLAEPHVSRWWNHEFTPEAVEREFGPSVDGTEPCEDYLALLDGEPIGLIQYSRFADYPEYVTEVEPVVHVPDGAVSIDYLIGDLGMTGRGVGTQMIRAFVERVWRADPTASCIIVPVNSSNVASWGALLRAGFELIGRGDMEPDNPIDDWSHEVLRVDRIASDSCS